MVGEIRDILSRCLDELCDKVGLREVVLAGRRRDSTVMWERSGRLCCAVLCCVVLCYYTSKSEDLIFERFPIHY